MAFQRGLALILAELQLLWTLVNSLSEGHGGWLCDTASCYKHDPSLLTFQRASRACADDAILTLPFPEIRTITSGEIWIQKATQKINPSVKPLKDSEFEAGSFESEQYSVRADCTVYNVTSEEYRPAACIEKHAFICQGSLDEYSVFRLLGLKLFDFIFILSVCWIALAFLVAMAAASAFESSKGKEHEEMRRFWAQRRRRNRSSSAHEAVTHV